MDSKNNDYHEPKSTPKLCLHSLPNKPPDPLGLVTPPLHTSASIPFQWEVVPGKPRTPIVSTPPCKSKVARSLDLPPRLVTEISNMASPTTVLDGRQFLSSTVSLSSPLGSFRSVEESGRKEIRERVKFSSWRWGSTPRGISVKPGLDFSYYVNQQNSDHIIMKKKINRKGSFLSFSNGGNSTNFLGNVYESIKKVVLWNGRRVKSRSMSI